MFSLKALQKTKSLFFKWRLHRVFFIFEKPLRTVSNITRLSKWIEDHKDLSYNDFYNPVRNGENRYGLYQYLIGTQDIDNRPITYLEFGVAQGVSFRWWVDKLRNPENKFIGFDTFTGLPEDWGHFKKGDMSNGNAAPIIDDKRHEFITGLFQQTLPGFIKKNISLLERRLIVHMDADLFSSTLFVLTSLAPYLKRGDIIIFDEFNVPNHEFLALEQFVQSYYIQYDVLGAVNNYYNLVIKIK